VSSRSLMVLRAYHPPETTPDHSVAASLAASPAATAMPGVPTPPVAR
jgi:isoamylase